MNDSHGIFDFGEPEKEKSIIKVIGVGGGGGNAVKRAYTMSLLCSAIQIIKH